MTPLRRLDPLQRRPRRPRPRLRRRRAGRAASAQRPRNLDSAPGPLTAAPGPRIRRGCLVHVVLTAWEWHPHQTLWCGWCQSDESLLSRPCTSSPRQQAKAASRSTTRARHPCRSTPERVVPQWLKRLLHPSAPFARLRPSRPALRRQADANVRGRESPHDPHSVRRPPTRALVLLIRNVVILVPAHDRGEPGRIASVR